MALFLVAQTGKSDGNYELTGDQYAAALLSGYAGPNRQTVNYNYVYVAPEQEVTSESVTHTRAQVPLGDGEEEVIIEEEIPLGIPKTGSNKGTLLAIGMILSAMVLAGATVVIHCKA